MKKKSAEINRAKMDEGGQIRQETDHRTLPTHDEIARVAFRLYESRGRQDGQAIEDWLCAEKELVRHSA